MWNQFYEFEFSFLCWFESLDFLMQFVIQFQIRDRLGRVQSSLDDKIKVLAKVLDNFNT